MIVLLGGWDVRLFGTNKLTMSTEKGFGMLLHEFYSKN